MKAKRAVLLDRDGTIIDQDGYLGDPAGVRLLPGAAAALKAVGAAGWERIVVSNQSGVARGLFTVEQYAKVEEAVRGALRREGADLEAVHVCHHLPGAPDLRWSLVCDCRKPKPGLLLRAAKERGLDLSRSVLVGAAAPGLAAGPAPGGGAGGRGRPGEGGAAARRRGGAGGRRARPGGGGPRRGGGRLRPRPHGEGARDGAPADGDGGAGRRARLPRRAPGLAGGPLPRAPRVGFPAMPVPPESAARYETLLRRFPRVRMGVVGDFLADRYIFGAPSRLSREAPVVILRWEGEHIGPGGAANAAANLAALGARVSCAGVLGQDVSGRALRARFAADGMDVEHLSLSRAARTVEKTRILAGDRHRSKQQVIRVDREPSGPPSPAAERAVLAAVRRLNGKLDGWLVSDYGYGGVTPRVFEALREGPGGAKRIVVVDSRRRGAEFSGATALTPNEDEAAEAAGLPVGSRAEVEACGAELLRRSGAAHVLITRGNQGLALFTRGERPVFVPVSGGNEEITDNNGAGDTVAATLAVALAAGACGIDAARLANHAGGVVVMKPGAATLTPAELRRQYRAHGAPAGKR